MTLSSGTLNLKFMQRAAARQQAQSPSTPAGPSTPSSARTPSQHVPASRDEKPSNSSVSRSSVLANAEAGPSTPGPVGHDQVDLTPAEKEARWSMPRPKPRRQDGEAARQGWEFEPGYMSFLLPTEEQGESSAGGGRMAFGGFGKREEETTGQDEDVDDVQEQAVEVLDPQESKKPRKRPRATDTSPHPDPTPAPRTFVKPEGFDDRPPHPHSLADKKPLKQLDQTSGTASAHHSPSRKKKRKTGSGPEHQTSQADRLRATISSARNANGSGSTTPLSRDDVADESGAGGSAATTQQAIDLTRSASPPAARPIAQEDLQESSSQKRKKKRKNKDRQSLGTATPTSLVSGTSSPVKISTSTPKGTSPTLPTASTLDEKQAQMKAEKRKRRKERKKLKNEGLKVEGDEMG